jgi:hypothetical protein
MLVRVMKELVKKVKILEPVDAGTVRINRDHYFRNAFAIDLPLDSTPDHVWQDFFEREWRSSRHLWDRKIFVIGDKLRLVTSETDLEDKLDWVKQIVVQTNGRIDEYQKRRRCELSSSMNKLTDRPNGPKGQALTLLEIWFESIWAGSARGNIIFG